MKKIIVIVAMLLLQACASGYTPREYPVRDGAINKFTVIGNVNVTNAQPSTESVMVYSRNAGELSSNLKSITDMMVQITKRELIKNSQSDNGNVSKSIELTVLSLSSQYKMSHWEGELHFQAKLGNGMIIEATTPYTTVYGTTGNNTLGSLNGSIAEGVVTLLNDQRVQLYLAQ